MLLFRISRTTSYELELELIQTQMTQKPMLRAEVCALLSSSGHPQKCVSLTKGTKRAVAALLIPVHLPHFFVCTPLEGSARARLLVSMQLASELELELIQTQMTQKPMLRAEVYARALRASQNRKEDSV